MTKIFKNIIISVCGVFAFLFAGFFFVGCQVDYSKIQLVSDRSNIELEVGESVDLTFTIENFKSGFSNKIQINPRADGQTAVFSCSEPIYLSQNQIKVTVTGVAGGNAQLSATTLEAGKECVVDISVTQYSKTMQKNNEISYVSNKTEFRPNANMFIFDANTTYKELSHFYLTTKLDINFTTFSLEEIDFENNVAYFTDGVGSVAEAGIQKFDKMQLKHEEGNALYLSLDDVETNIPLVNEFLMLSVYDYSLNNDNYEKIVYAVSSGYVLPDINVSMSGGYIDMETGYANFVPVEDKNIRIVPNNNQMLQYILKIEMNNSITDMPLRLEKYLSNNFVDVDFFDYVEHPDSTPTDNVVYYLKISQNSQTQNTSKLSFDIFYDIAQGIDDESVNVKKEFDIKIEIAPTSLMINGTTEPENLVLYNFYRFPDFGWNDLFVDVVSGIESSPNFEGIYFTFDSKYIDLVYDGVTVVSGEGKLYTDLNKPFLIRGVYGSSQINTELVVHLKSDILPNGDELTLSLPCSIIAGATVVSKEIRYDDYKYFYLDYDGGTVSFSQQIFADQKFQFTTYQFLNGIDVLDINNHNENPYIHLDSKYYLNLSLTPKTTGIGMYRFYLDNGMEIDLMFNVVKTLSPQRTEVKLSNEGNESVTNFAYSRTEDSEFDNVLNLEILNPSDKDDIIFGNTAFLEIVANVVGDSIKFVPNESRFVSIAKVNSAYRLTTLDNGETIITFSLSGLSIDDFETHSKELKIYVYVSSYSLVSEYYLKNGENYALNNTVYYGEGDLKDEDISATLTPVVNNSASNNFYQYFFAKDAFVDIFENALESSIDNKYTYEIKNNQYYTELVYERFNKKFIYFFAQNEKGEVKDATTTEVVVTKSWTESGNIKNESKTIMLVLNNGLMFLSSDLQYVQRNELGDVIATYSVSFSNQYSIGVFGDFDMDSFTYRNRFKAVHTLVLNSNIRQRNLTKRYDARITANLYQSVESISLASNLTKLNFTNNELKHTIGVYTFPSNSTNKNIRVEFIRTNENPYSNMLTWNIDTKEKDNGVYTINLSCENFFDQHKDEIVDIQDSLTGKIFIYPAEWGDSYTSINTSLKPIEIDVHYRNGSQANPYLLETAEDVVAINSNETTLKSHYELGNVIDMSTVSNFKPIGVLTVDGVDTLVGFSGSITGSNSQAAITNIVVSANNFSASILQSVNGSQTLSNYYGLFAQINAPTTQIEDGEFVTKTPKIENVTFSGKFDLKLSDNSYVGLISAVNKGDLINVGAKISKSSIVGVLQKTLYYGGVAGVNYGNIIQDFTKYDGSTQNQQYDFTNQNSKILAYYEGELVVNAPSMIVYAGGIAGASNGVVERIESKDLKMYGYAAYSAYSLIKFEGVVSFDSHQDLYVGGAVGAISFYNKNSPSNSFLPEDKTDLNGQNKISNLLVGGEINTENTTNYIDHVGGIVGVSNTVNRAEISIVGNTSRVFLRGWEYVGAISGFDYHSSGDNVSVDFGTQNVIEAVDDGRNSFYGSSIIKLKKLNELPADNSKAKNAFFAIGNATRNGRSYEPFNFEAYSYLKRNFISVSQDDKVLSNSISTSEFYGDYVVAEKNVDTTYTIYNAFKFVEKDISLNLGNDSPYQMVQADGNNDFAVFFMYYFSVLGRLNGDVGAAAQDEIDRLNFITPNSKDFYPFEIDSQDVNITTSTSNILSVDVNGNLTVKSTGFAVIKLSSILNIVKSKEIYIWVVNYFDKDVKASLFYTSNSSNGINITDESSLNIYGNSNTNLNLVPTYELSEGKTADGVEFSVTKDGVLNFENVNYVLAKNSQLTVDEPSKSDFIKTADTEIVEGKEYFKLVDGKTNEYEKVLNPVLDDIGDYFEQDNYFSSVQINKQTVIFFKQDSSVSEGEEDNYVLVPVLKTTIQIGNEKFTFYYKLASSMINLGVKYKETATSIRTSFKYHSMQTNNFFEDSVVVTSTNPNEVLFYQIFDENGELVQNRLPSYVGQINENSWQSFINFENANIENRLFDIRFARGLSQNVFDFTCRVDTMSKKFANRFNKSIFGEYTVHLYSSELENGVSYSFKILLSEAEINHLGINNFSNIKDISLADDVVVPSQRGVLEISVDPVEAVFDEFKISNNNLNYQSGAAEAMFSFVYEKISSTGVEYVVSPNFGKYVNGTYSFKYQEMIDYYKELNEKFEKGASANYYGKIYISYFMPSNNVSDSVPVGFDVSVSYGNNGSSFMETSVFLNTKLGSFAKLKFSDKQSFDGVYFVARGLSYNLTLDYYGFSEDQISIKSSNNFVADVLKVNGSYVLKVTPESINYTNDIGYKIVVETVASKVVDNVTITTQDTLTVYVMEYVMDYIFVEGQNEDIVKGMENGVIYSAIGNPYKLEIDIRNFLEYDSTNPVVNTEVENFVQMMTQKIDWTVYLNKADTKTATKLEENKKIREEFYSIESFTVTPLKLYNPESDIYHFSANAFYTMKNGIYAYSEFSANANQMYTEFAFEVHQQSTQDSPIPIETYQEFMDMKDGEWYILLKDIALPGAEDAAANNVEQFKPITRNIAGLDGNDCKFTFKGNYNFNDLTNVGLFANVGEGTIIKNVKIQIGNDDVTFKTNMSTFNIGLIAAENSGIITNCLVESLLGKTLSVSCSETATSSFVAGLVANNSGYITNSRSKINIITNVNLSGFVGQNSGIIASSYFMGGSLKNQTNTTSEYTAGFAVSNSGKIFTSYVSGQPRADSVFYNKSTNNIQSSNNIAGFVYSNSGEVEDCYSNIQLRQSGAFASGFVFENSGTVSKCFSTSVLESRQTSNYGFARANNIDTSLGTISECYYLEDADAKVYENDNDSAALGTGVNISIGTINYDEQTDITALTCEEFGNLEEYFKEYVTVKGRDINSVWFFNENPADTKNFNGSIFNVRRLELVAPNIVAQSKRQLDRVETIVDETTGATSAKYIYIYSSDSPALGTVYNPILIDNPQNMEDYVLQENNSANYNYGYYRLVSDVDYSEYLYNSKLFKTKFMGYLEGNFMSVNNITLLSSEAMESAGLFAQVGKSTLLNSVGTIMNFNIRPKAVSFANANIVGGVAGIVDGGKVLNVEILNETNDLIMVSGTNIVGGAVGLATGKYKIQNVYSQLGAKARKQIEGNSNNFDNKSTIYTEYSFAGSFAGILSGDGSVYNCHTDTAISVLGHKVGLMFGLIDSGATVSKVRLDVLGEMSLNSYGGYAGLVAGECKGTVTDVDIISFGAEFENFKKIPYAAIAVGGFAGIIDGGQISDVESNQSILISNQSSSTGIDSLGGLAGEITGAAVIKNIDLHDISLIGFKNIGGLAGKINSKSNVVNFVNINVDNCLLRAYGVRLLEVGLGGLAGRVEENSVVSLSATHTEDVRELQEEIGKLDDTKLTEKAELQEKLDELLANPVNNNFVINAEANIYVYSSDITIFVGGIIGCNKSTVPHLIYDTNSSVSGASSALDMTGNYDLFKGSVKVENKEEGGEQKPSLVDNGVETVDQIRKRTIETTTLIAVRTNFFCDVTFETVSGKAHLNSKYYMVLNLYGTAYIPTAQ